VFGLGLPAMLGKLQVFQSPLTLALNVAGKDGVKDGESGLGHG
jgi:hypothetical protein